MKLICLHAGIEYAVLDSNTYIILVYFFVVEDEV